MGAPLPAHRAGLGAPRQPRGPLRAAAGLLPQGGNPHARPQRRRGGHRSDPQPSHVPDHDGGRRTLGRVVRRAVRGPRRLPGEAVAVLPPHAQGLGAPGPEGVGARPGGDHPRRLQHGYDERHRAGAGRQGCEGGLHADLRLLRLGHHAAAAGARLRRVLAAGGGGLPGPAGRRAPPAGGPEARLRGGPRRLFRRGPPVLAAPLHAPPGGERRDGGRRRARGRRAATLVPGAPGHGAAGGPPGRVEAQSGGPVPGGRGLGDLPADAGRHGALRVVDGLDRGLAPRYRAHRRHPAAVHAQGRHGAPAAGGGPGVAGLRGAA
mmetsp:Transcript_63515/g.186377  ORF Transcript_63515/g.186377 Transcript_63515/m.186377 type:complete len:320 (+) Transcript_63515:337-1296(+)